MYWEARNPQQVYSYYPRYYIDVCEHELDSTLDSYGFRLYFYKK